MSFLLDAHIPHALAHALWQLEPGIEVFMLGRPDTLPIHAPDPDLLIWIEQHNCYLVTNNRASMPDHLRDHLASGRHIAGILVVSKHGSLGDLAEELHLIWGASLPDEYKDQIIYLPIRR